MFVEDHLQQTRALPITGHQRLNRCNCPWIPREFGRQSPFISIHEGSASFEHGGCTRKRSRLPPAIDRTVRERSTFLDRQMPSIDDGCLIGIWMDHGCEKYDPRVNFYGGLTLAGIHRKPCLDLDPAIIAHDHSSV